jgi:pimeloyl-ACP methyl ester carboxylesterase
LGTVSLNFESAGSGTPVIALHGYGATLFSWRDLPAALPDRRVIRVDLPGHGGSPTRADGRYGPQDDAEAVMQLIDEQKLPPFDLIGHSLGGGVALSLALQLCEQRPGALRSLVLLDSIALPQTFPFFITIARMPGIGPLSLRLLPPRFVTSVILRRAFYDPRRITPEMVDAYSRNLTTPERREALTLTARQLVPDNLPRLIEGYARLPVPTLLLWGEQDRIVDPNAGAELNNRIPNSRLIYVERCGHVPHEERPEVALPHIASFLAGPSPTDAKS